MNSPVTIVGAGPNGLSIAAHLNSRGVRPAIFGRPMEFWRAGMSPRMRLKSDGFASNLSEPSGKFTLEAFCRSQGLPYENTLSPVPRSTFVKYGEAFQKRFVRQLDTRHVRAIVPTFAGFRLEL